MVSIHTNITELYGFLGRIQPDHVISQGIAEGRLHPNTYVSKWVYMSMCVYMSKCVYG